ncbi:MAG: hypothetical protein ACREQO_15550 [Candidatus Binatia bacterium]
MFEPFDRALRRTVWHRAGSKTRMMLNLSVESGLIDLPKLFKKLFISIIFCLLGFAILSNRFLLLRQSRFSHTQQAGLHLPLDNPVQSHQGRRIILLATADERVSDLDQLARDFSEIATNAIQQPRVLFKLPTPLSLRPPTYILQSALNL